MKILSIIKKFFHFILSEEFNQQAMIFKLEREMELEKGETEHAKR